MRQAFIGTLTELAERDPRVLLLTGDLGFTVVEPFAERFPDRFINVGVAEQNMVGLATGLAEAGFIPFVYSIVTFASLRAYEFIRNGPVLHQLAVRIVGVGGGFEYGPAGPSHHGLEDLAIMRLQPGMTVLAPADALQTRVCLRTTWDLPGPVYYRLGKDEQTALPGLAGAFRLGGAHMLRSGHNLLFVTTGAMATEVLAAAEDLASDGIQASVLLVTSLSPAPLEDLLAALNGRHLVMTVEAHYVTGGLGSLVAEVIAERGLGCRLIRCGVERPPDGLCGSDRYLRELHGLSSRALVERAHDALAIPL
jgi:transketolase